MFIRRLPFLLLRANAMVMLKCCVYFIYVPKISMRNIHERDVYISVYMNKQSMNEQSVYIYTHKQHNQYCACTHTHSKHQAKEQHTVMLCCYCLLLSLARTHIHTRVYIRIIYLNTRSTPPLIHVNNNNKHFKHIWTEGRGFFGFNIES